MRRALYAEWGKLWSLRAPWFCVLAGAVVTAMTAWTLANDFVHDIGDHSLPATDTLAVPAVLAPSVQLGQIALVALAMLAVTTEYGTGVIRGTFLARPRRPDVLLAKTMVASVVCALAGVLCAALGWAGAAWSLSGHEASADPVAGCLRVGLAVGCAAAFTVAVAFLLRSSAGTLTSVFLLLVGLSLVDDRVSAYTPAGAAIAYMSGESSQYPSWAGLAVLAAWTLAAQVLAWRFLVRRDA